MAWIQKKTNWLATIGTLLTFYWIWINEAGSNYFCPWFLRTFTSAKNNFVYGHCCDVTGMLSHHISRLVLRYKLFPGGRGQSINNWSVLNGKNYLYSNKIRNKIHIDVFYLYYLCSTDMEKLLELFIIEIQICCQSLWINGNEIWRCIYNQWQFII